jgi:hypothetical protein
MIARILTLTLFVLFASAAAGQARDVTMPFGKGTVTIAFPKSWNVSAIDRGLEAKTSDEEVFVWAEAITDAQIDQLMKEHRDYFTQQGVAVTGKIQSEAKIVNGLNMKVMSVPATWHGNPTVLQYLLVDPGLASGWTLMLSEWASPKGDKMYQADLDTIMNTLSFGK